jgi:hypothetical protein
MPWKGWQYILYCTVQYSIGVEVRAMLRLLLTDTLKAHLIRTERAGEKPRVQKRLFIVVVLYSSTVLYVDVLYCTANPLHTVPLSSVARMEHDWEFLFTHWSPIQSW